MSTAPETREERGHASDSDDEHTKHGSRTQPQRESLAVLFLRVHREVITAAETLWGLWLIPLALLVWRCDFLPRMLAVWLTLNGLAYIAQSVVGFVMPQLSDSLDGICFPLQLGEIAFMLWLLAFGARRNILMNLPKSM